MKTPQLDETRINDYPVLRGKEVMLRATLEDGSAGECFTDNPISFKGQVQNILEINNRACIIATLNAVMRFRGDVHGTIHCTGDCPEKCSELLYDYLKDMDLDKVGLIGFQPAFVKKLYEEYGDKLLVTDLNPENIGAVKYGAKILSGEEYNDKLIADSDMVIATGSTVSNETFMDILKMAVDKNKRIIFYGTTIAAPSLILGVNRFCPLGN